MASPNGIPQLSCELCRDRKVKCDKLNPCTNCVRAQTPCIPVYRRRLPRGRHVHRDHPDSDLRDRVRRLETLVNSMNTGTSFPTESSSACLSKRPINNGKTAYPPCRPEQHASAVSATGAGRIVETDSGGQLAQQFWGDLLEEIQGLRDLVDQPPEEDGDGEDSDSNGHENTEIPIHSCNRVLGLGSSFMNGHLAMRPSQAICVRLGEIYLKQVDPLIKILHRPSVAELMIHSGRYLHYKPNHASVEALACAICYAAVNSMTEEQCQSILNISKSSAMLDYRVQCEYAFQRAGLVSTDDMTVLQAFVLYLLTTRFIDQSRAVWTLVSVAVRIAQALQLNLDDGRPPESFFNQQMRRRLWYTICMLDLHFSLNQPSDPLITPDLAQPSLPLNINDSDFGPSSDGNLTESAGLTDTTFALMTYSIQKSARILNFASSRRPSEMADTWDDRLHHARQFEQRAARLLQNCDPEASPYAWFVLRGSGTMAAAMQLSALRPLYRAGQRPPPQVQGNTHLLQLAGRMLENSYLIQNDPRGERFRWHIVVKWHTLAIAIAECYSCSDVELIRWVWPLIEEYFPKHSLRFAAGQQQGTIQRPLERLMERTRRKIEPLLVDHTEVPAFSSDQAGSHFETAVVDTSLEDPVPMPMLPDPSWDTWTEFVNDISFDGLTDGDLAMPFSL